MYVFTYIHSFYIHTLKISNLHRDFYYSYKPQFSSVTQPCLTLCDPKDYNTPGFPVHHQLLEIAQPHVYRVSDAIQPFHSLPYSSPPDFNVSQHQGLFQ